MFAMMVTVFVCAISAGGQQGAETASQPAVELPAWEMSSAVDGQPFDLDAGAPKVQIWGRRAEPPRAFFDEFLPALFDRTLVLQEVDLGDGALEWVFNGERAGFTVRIDRKTVQVAQRYYDSFGHHPLDGDEFKPARHPERRWLTESVRYNGDLRSVGVILDHRLGLWLALNGKRVLHQHCPFEVSRHQLRVIGEKAHVRGVMVTPDVQEALVRIDPSMRFQEILGFGGIATPTAYAQLSPEGKRKWWQILCEYNLLIQREYPIGTRLNKAMDNWDRLSDATPHYYGNNFANGEISDFDYLRKVREIGGMVWFEFWQLPPWARKVNEKGTLTNIPDIEKYTRAMVRYCEVSQEKAGAPPDVVGIQNEVRQPAEVWRDMTLGLREALDEAGFENVKIHMHDSGGLAGGIRAARAFTSYPEAWKTVDYAATHMYDYQRLFVDPDGFDEQLLEWKKIVGDKPFLSTELCINSPHYQMQSYRVALAMGQLYHKNLAMTDASAICYCWLLLNTVEPSYGWTRSLMVPDRSHGFMPAASSHQLRVFGAYSRRVHRGMVRVKAESSLPNLQVCAFVGSGEKRTLVLLNRDIAAVDVTVTGSGTPFRYHDEASPYDENRVTVLDSSTTRVRIQPGGIVTLSTVPLLKLPAGFVADGPR